MPKVRVAAAQLNTVVGDLEGNAARILDAYEAAAAAGADLVVFPELTITGYPPEDLLLRPAFVAEAAETSEKLAARTGTTAAIVGFPEPGRDLSECGGRPRARQGAGHLPQAPAAELRGVRRAQVLRARRRLRARSS